jgi:preprotein translocase subunit SecG
LLAHCAAIGYNPRHHGVLVMTTIILTIHILIAVALVGVILLQRNEGGGLGIGGGGQGGGFMTARGTANTLTRATTVLAIAFFCTSIVLAILAGGKSSPRSVLDEVIEESENAPVTPAIPTVPTDQ